LGFLGTILFSALALWQNEIIKEEADKNQRMHEEMETKRVEPRFHIALIHSMGSSGGLRRMNVAIENICDERVHGIVICNMKNVNTDGSFTKFIWEKEIGVINAGGKFTTELLAPENKQNQHIEFQIKCKDIYDRPHTFLVSCSESKTIESEFKINRIND